MKLGLKALALAIMLGACTSGIILGACTSGPMPAAQLTEAKSALSAARAVGADREPRAALHLKMASDQIRTAEALIAGGENDEARYTLARARSDAQLAQELTREAEMKRRAAALEQQVRGLERAEVERPTPSAIP